ncbi:MULTISPECIES: amidohydrolase [Janthinobacterium]|uniref:amidohydrolase family protein n=1 Tax=Janthinobacterium TaxID=29580 RepID=UPI001C5B1488|nr:MULTISPECIES: amidohydrolase family protein [Janthinobacterium]MBW3512980.1 amidohydrolase family protein [Janthinobacterium sp. NKUCC06_STL]MCA1862959.1 amidohydrolase family protein [Janthinobacterium lividum]
MMRIDAHQHFWQLAARAGSWPPPTLAAIHRDFAPADMAPLLAAHGIAGTVLVQSLPSEDDTYWLLALAEQNSFIRAVVGWTDLLAPDAAAAIACLASQPKLKGLRPMLQDIDDNQWIANPALAPALAAMVEHGLRLDALVLPRHLPALLQCARDYPRLAIVIDHAAKPPIADAAFGAWREDMAQLAALPNVHCKLSGLVTEARPGWHVDDLRPYAVHVLNVFGPRRVIWGSDWPVVDLAGGYAAWLAASEALLAHLGQEDKDDIFGRNACRFYGFE